MNEQRRAPGWPGMMAEHQFTVVPDAALDLIVSWLAEGAGPPARMPRTCAAASDADVRDSIGVSFPTGAGDITRL